MWFYALLLAPYISFSLAVAPFVRPQPYTNCNQQQRETLNHLLTASYSKLSRADEAAVLTQQAPSADNKTRFFRHFGSLDGSVFSLFLNWVSKVRQAIRRDDSSIVDIVCHLEVSECANPVPDTVGALSLRSGYVLTQPTRTIILVWPFDPYTFLSVESYARIFSAPLSGKIDDPVRI